MYIIIISSVPISDCVLPAHCEPSNNTRYCTIKTSQHKGIKCYYPLININKGCSYKTSLNSNIQYGICKYRYKNNTKPNNIKLVDDTYNVSFCGEELVCYAHNDQGDIEFVIFLIISLFFLGCFTISKYNDTTPIFLRR